MHKTTDTESNGTVHQSAKHAMLLLLGKNRCQWNKEKNKLKSLPDTKSTQAHRL